MRENFEKAVSFTLAPQIEGYKSDDPDDPGGRTIFGISSRMFPETVRELWDLPKEEALQKAKDFYLEHFWKPAGCDDVASMLDIFVFDCAVNQGINTAKSILAVSHSPTQFLVERICHYVDLAEKNPKSREYFRGWINRTILLYRQFKN